ncbi:hypothetical protein K9N08_04840 [Candidatus Gracilibacteria bacterium]|nr:hypothetical protein [Candidatus Gracilibacteria bacterium]MCF7856829.1 hypothetical protein [Candidatus Gracilibacteria bacterium]MCF7897097.1 hypothetical protein [Candidatus Gracilibacteria bacterium]
MENLLLEKPKLKWYFQTSFLMVTFLMAGPLVLPLILWHPSLSRQSKFFWSGGIILISYLMWLVLVKSLASIEAYYSLALPYL